MIYKYGGKVFFFRIPNLRYLLLRKFWSINETIELLWVRTITPKTLRYKSQERKLCFNIRGWMIWIFKVVDNKNQPSISRERDYKLWLRKGNH